MTKKIILAVIVAGLLGIAVVSGIVFYVSSNLPNMSALNDYAPLLVSEVYDVKGKKIGEFTKERRILIPYEQVPELQVKAFVAAEDDTFFQHSGINYLAILRAMLVNLKEGRKAQGGSTITQQVAKSLLLTSEKSYIRKIREILLSYRIESNLTKEQILYLYLNQIYLGQSAYGVEAAAQSYYRKPIQKTTLAEMAILSGLPQAPSRYSPITNPSSAKQRQRYVLERMATEGFIDREVAKKTAEEPVVIYVRERFEDLAPYFLETVRQNLVPELGESTVWDKGIKIYTTLDLEKQLAAQEGVQKGLRDLDKKQGYRGAPQNLQGKEAMDAFLSKTRAALIDEKTPKRVLMPDGTLIAFEDFQKLKADEKAAANPKAKTPPAPPKEVSLLPWFIKAGEVVNGVVTVVDDSLGLVHVQLPDCMGLIDIKTMAWARKPDSKVRFYQAQITKPSQALNVGDVIEVRVGSGKFDPSDYQDRIAALNKGKKTPAVFNPPQFEKYLNLDLEQEPEVEAALISYDLKKQDILAMVGGYDFRKSKFNRAIQAARQTGSSFKPIVYAAALDAGFTPASVIYDAPIVFKDEDSKSKVQKGIKEDEDQDTTWKPANYGSKFGGDILFRDALVQSKNVPTVRIMDKIGVSKVNEYSRRMGIFSPLNLDLSMGLGSSSVTLYEMTKVMGTFATNGRRLRPRMLISVKSREGKTLLENVSLDQRFQTQLQALDQENEEKRKAYLEKIAAASEAEQASGGTPHAEMDENEALQKRLKQYRRLYYDDPDQLISPQTAFLITNLLTGVINDPNGTGGRARALGKNVAGKTGSTSDYYDAWFVGYSPSVATGVWVGFDSEKSMGVGATGGEAALPIWMHYMQTALKDVDDEEFKTPPGIVFANIDKDTGRLASARSKRIYRQAFLQGTEPTSTSEQAAPEQEKDMMKDEIQ